MHYNALTTFYFLSLNVYLKHKQQIACVLDEQGLIKSARKLKSSDVLEYLSPILFIFFIEKKENSEA